MLGGSYIKNTDGSVTLVQRTLDPEEAKAAKTTLDEAAMPPEAEGAVPPVDPPETKPPGKPGRKDI